ncbi:MAG: S8 family peptidase, partial [Steroidobacteraceae bacterium]
STSADAAARAVRLAGGHVLSPLSVIDAVGAELSADQAAALRGNDGLRLYANVALQVSAAKAKTAASTTTTTTTTTDYLRTTSADGTLQLSELQRAFTDFGDYSHSLLVGAPDLHKQGITGKGVTVAVVDTGLWWESSTLLSKAPRFRFDSTNAPQNDDPNGHGTHVSSIIASNRLASNMIFEGIAPAADIGAVRAFHYDGSSAYIDAIEAIDYVVKNRKSQNIRVLNLSFSAPPQSYYWDDPLNQAVMKAWQAGIVVVAAAGNDGPNPMTIGVPGNVPYIITVGAMTDSNTPAYGADDRLASFSSTGPTFEGFVKPEVVAPGGHITGSMPFDGWIATLHPDSMLDSQRQFKMSGTSQATAIVSGIVALMLQKNPLLTPDEVKCKLMASARPAVNGAGQVAYSVFQQGAGLVNAPAAANSTATKCANQGLDIAADLAGRQHFGGPANADTDGNYYVLGADGTVLSGEGLLWDGGFAWDGAYVWSDAKLWSRSDLWSSAKLWSRGKLWSRSVNWIEGQAYSNGQTEIRSIAHWVEHE